MRLLGLLLTLNLLFAVVCLASDEITIPFELNNGLILIDVEVDGKVSKFILDTGAGDVLVDEKDYHSVLLSRDQEKFTTINGDVEARTVSIKNINIEGLTLAQNHKVYGIDLVHLENFTQTNLGGILGGYLLGLDIRVDFINKLISTQISLTESQNYFTFNVINNVPLVKTNLDGHEVYFILDSGASSHIIDHKHKAHVRGKSTSKNNLITANGDVKQAESMIGHSVIANVKVDGKWLISDCKSLSMELGVPIGGIVSLSNLSTQGITINYTKNHLYFN